MKDKNTCEQTTLAVREVLPDSPAWTSFLQMSHRYFLEGWPAEFPAEFEAFAIEYGAGLRQRWNEGERGVFMFADAGGAVGFANVYLDENRKRFNVAEFYVTQERRREHLGRRIFLASLEWGALHGADQVRIEVDDANGDGGAFWSHFPMNKDKSASRHVFTADLRALLTALRGEDEPA